MHIRDGDKGLILLVLAIAGLTLGPLQVIAAIHSWWP